jgi:hypothetical protein
MSSISGSFSSSFVQQALAAALQSSGLSSSSGSSGASGGAAAGQADSSQVSPLGQIASTLQQLRESNPSKYKQVTEAISTNLLEAAQTAKSQGNSGAANELTKLANDFAAASQSGQLPNFSGTSQAAGSGGGHHHHHHGSSGAGSTPAAASSSGASSGDAASIILNTLSNLGQNAQA